MMSEQAVYGAVADSTKPRVKVRTHHLHKWKAEGHKWAMLTAYDYSTAAAFDEAEIPVLLVGDSAANVVYGYDTTVPISIDELIPLVRGVVRGAPHALVIAALPFGGYVRMLGDDPAEEEEFPAPEPFRDAVIDYGVKAGIGQNDLPFGACGRIARHAGRDIFAKCFKHHASPPCFAPVLRVGSRCPYIQVPY